MNNNPLISFVILTWNSKQTIIDCVKSIMDKCTAEDISYDIFIVDNGSTDETIRVLRNAFEENEHLIYISLAKNRGTTYPRNIALSRARGELVCVMDSDAVFQNGHLEDIISLINDRSVGIVAPKLILPDGSVQHSVKKFPSALSKLWKIPQIIFRINMTNMDFYAAFPFSRVTEVDTAISACWFLHRELIDEVGLLDEKIFYSPEDIDYCLRIRKIGKKIIYYPFFHVLHHTQQITHRKRFSRHAISHFKGLIYYFIKHRYFIAPRLKS